MLDVSALLVFLGLGLLIMLMLATIPGHVARERLHSQADAINVCAWVGVLLPLVWLIALVWAFTEDHRDDVPPPLAIPDGPGDFRVVGVDRATGKDVKFRVTAASAANARAKVELKNVTVTGVSPLAPASGARQ